MAVIEESGITGIIHPPMNHTFIALIPKSDDPSSYNDFRPISLCKCRYKIISKIIANRIKPILSTHISSEQFAFLHHRHIQEALGTAQESLHSIKHKNLKGISLKIDLAKAFDKVNWLYLKMILTHLGFPLFLSPGLWDVSLPSPSLFSPMARPQHLSTSTGNHKRMSVIPTLLPACYGRSKQAHHIRQKEWEYQWPQNYGALFLTHLLFVDDILIFINGSVRDSTTLNEILQLFCSATGMEIKRGKSSISLSGCTNQETQLANQKFPFQETNILEGIKYLGFILKPDGYKIENWTWLITKIENRINCWHHRLLSKAGRLMLIKSVLEATPVYWMSLS